MKNKRVFRVTLIFALLLLIGVTIFLGCYFYGMKDYDFLLGKIKISENSNVNYTVILKDEDFKKDSKTDKYITNLIKKIIPSFNYNVAFNDIVEGDYSYNIIGKLQALDKNGRVLVNKKIYDNAGIRNTIKGKVINISNAFDIKVSDYKKMYDSLVEEYGIDLKGNLIFDINIEYNVFNENISRDVNGEKVLTINIPLGEETTNIEIPKETTIKRTEYSNAKEEYTSPYFIVSLELFGASFLFILVLMYLIRYLYINVDKYDVKLAKITSKYKGRLVKIKKMPDLSKYDVLFVDDIKSLDDASINVMSPINYVEVIKNKESVFMVFMNNKVYVYKLSRLMEDTI